MAGRGGRGVQEADPGAVRVPGAPLLRHRPALGRRRHRSRADPHGPRARPVRLRQRAARGRRLRRLPDVIGGENDARASIAARNERGAERVRSRTMTLFDTVLVANRGEIAVRVIRTLRAMGIRSVAVHSDADVGALHTRLADVAVPIGPAPAAQSYLSIERVLDAARRPGAPAIPPGYGFLAENVEFARACEQAGIVFIGPPVAAIEAMGDKIRAKQTVSAAGVPVVPGRTEPGMSDEQVIDAAVAVGFPVLLKPSAGGGGKGMRVVRGPGELAEQISAARREARSSFGDDTLLVERYLGNSRHIEVQ